MMISILECVMDGFPRFFFDDVEYLRLFIVLNVFVYLISISFDHKEKDVGCSR